MTDKKLTDAQRQIILVFITRAWVDIKNEPEFIHNAHELVEIIEMFSGTDTEIISRKPHHREDLSGRDTCK